MKKIFITILLAALMPFAAGAQDARQRTAETIVADALAQLPAQTPKAFDSLMQELAATGADGIRMMAAMLVPAAEGKNAPVEYAINGVVSYVTAAGREELAREIRAGLTDAVAASTDKPNQAFLLSQLQLCATAAEAPVFVKYAADEYLADYAVRGLISTPGTDGEILALIDASPAPDALLAYAAAEKRLAAAEPALLKWAADPKAGTPTKVAVYNALAKCGTAASIAPLAAAAKADGYAFTKTDATGAYVALLARLAAAGNSKAVAAAKALRKTGMPQNVRAAGLGIVLGTDAKKQTPELLAALKDADREYRCAALDFAGDFADDALYAAVVKKMPSLSDAAKTDIVSWLGARHAASQANAVIAAISSADEELALAAIRAAGKIGGQEALNALGWWSSQVALGVAYAQKVQRFFDTDSTIEASTDGEKASDGPFSVRFDHVSYRYGGNDEFAIRDLSLAIAPGEKIAIVGENGAGKTTLTKLLLRLYDADGGTVQINGRPIADYDVSTLRGRIGIAFQQSRLYALSVRENMTAYADADDARLKSCLEEVGLRLSLDAQVTKEFDENGAVLSGGDAQRLCLTRLLHSEFGLLILDEPSSALDPIAEYRIAKLIFDRSPTTTVMVAHRLSTVVDANRIYLLSDGRIIESGTHAELMAQNGKYREMFLKQAEGYLKA